MGMAEDEGIEQDEIDMVRKEEGNRLFVKEEAMKGDAKAYEAAMLYPCDKSWLWDQAIV